MTNQQKTALAVLFLIAALFVAAVLLGVGQGEGMAGATNPDDVDWAQWFGSWLVKSAPLKSRETSAQCKVGASFELAAGQTCSVLIDHSSLPVRRARLELADGGPVQVVLRQPGSIDAKGTLGSAHDAVELDVFGGKKQRDRPPARLGLTCLMQAGRCTVRLVS